MMMMMVGVVVVVVGVVMMVLGCFGAAILPLRALLMGPEAAP